MGTDPICRALLALDINPFAFVLALGLAIAGTAMVGCVVLSLWPGQP